MRYTIQFGKTINHEKHYEQAKSLLIMLFGEVQFSEPTYSRDYNAAPDDENASTYLNFTAAFTTLFTPHELRRLLKKLEREMGRKPKREAEGIIDADFDLVKWRL